MRRILKIAVPYEHLSGYGLFSKRETMNYVQKIVTALVLSHEELKITTQKLAAAIESNLGLYKHNHIVIEKDLQYLFDNISEKQITNPLNKKVGILANLMNKYIINSIYEDNRYWLLSPQKPKNINVELYLPMFKGLSIIDSISAKLTGDKGTRYNPSIHYDEDQRKDILSEKLDKHNSSILVLKKDKIIDEGNVVWVEKDIEVEIIDNKVSPNSHDGQIILDLILGNNIKYDLQTLLNTDIDKYLLSNIKEYKGGKKSEMIDRFDKDIISWNNLNILKEYDTFKLLYYNEDSASYKNKNLKVKNVVAISHSLIELIETFYNDVDDDFLILLDNKQKKELVKHMLIKDAYFEKVTSTNLYDYFSYSMFQEMSVEELTSALKDLNLKKIFLPKLFTEFKNKDIKKYQEATKEKYETVFKLFDYKYTNEGLFKDWDLEKKLFTFVNGVKGLDYSNLSQNDLNEKYGKLLEVLPKIFANQSIVKETNKQFKDMLKHSSEWSKEEINYKAVALRQRIEDTVKSSKAKTIREKIKEFFDKKTAEKIVNIHHILSNDIIHKNNNSLTKKVKIIKEAQVNLPKLLKNKKRGN